MIHITEQQVLEILAMPKAIELVEESFRELEQQAAINHPRRRVILSTGSVLHYMAAGNDRYFGIKVYSTNPKTGAHFTFLLYRSEDGMPLASIEANHLGQIRTGAASAVATRRLAREEAKTLGVIGSGFQAETQIAAVASVRRFTEIRVWSRKPEKREGFARRLADRGIPVGIAGSAREAVEGMDVVITATSAREPVLESAWISPGTHINAMGSNWTNRRELPTDLILDRSALIAVDSVEDGRLESGDLTIPVAERPDTPFPAVELYDAKRTSPHQITIFKSNGLAIQDVLAAGYVYEQVSGYS
jgi:ornithine cyclodeaminase/alanine dehydrogenase-like protein (mu-crystallin family)